MTQRDQSWWDQAVADIQSRVTASRPSTTVATTTNPSSTTTPSNSTSATSGTQFVQTRDGSVNYDAIPFEQYTGSMNNAFNQTTDAQRQMIDLIGSWRLRDPNTQATADATRTTADAAMRQAEAAYKQAGAAYLQAQGRDEQDIRNQWVREQQAASLERRYNAGQADANRDLDRYLAGLRKETELGVASSNKQAQLGTARINQPLSAEQILEKSRIENPDPIKGMAVNLLGGYANQGTRSNFAYWG